MKCLSLWQPWATLHVCGAKLIETRSWATSHRGLLAIHAAKKRSAELDHLQHCDPFPGCLYGHLPLPYGCIVGIVDLEACVPTHKLRPTLTGVELAFGDYRDGRFGWVTKDRRKFDEPIPYRGAQGLFDVPDELLKGK